MKYDFSLQITVVVIIIVVVVVFNTVIRELSWRQANQPVVGLSVPIEDAI